MKNIFIVLKREYLVRVRKKSFIIMTLLTPILMAAVFTVPAYFAATSVEEKKIEVVDESGLFVDKFKDTDELKFKFISTSIAQAKTNFAKSGYDILTFIPKDIKTNPKGLEIFAEKSVSLQLQSNIENTIETELENIGLLDAGIDKKTLEATRVSVSADTHTLGKEGEKDSSSGASTVIGYFCGFLIYISIFIYGAQVMRGVMEEKMSRIVEVVISSVKPFELMMGKISGVALVGLTQFMLWIGLTIAITTASSQLLGTNRFEAQSQQVQTQIAKTNPKEAAKIKEKTDSAIQKGINALKTLNIPLIIGSFLFYFFGGYLLYSALFAAIGSAVDNETDTQQFMLPISIPIILAMSMLQFIINEPDGALAFWMSMIPFTSPIIMMVRIPFGVPAWEIALSMTLLVAGFVFTTWLAARIYRIGILMYGKKVSYKELSKWLFYKG